MEDNNSTSPAPVYRAMLRSPKRDWILLEQSAMTQWNIPAKNSVVVQVSQAEIDLYRCICHAFDALENMIRAKVEAAGSDPDAMEEEALRKARKP